LRIAIIEDNESVARGIAWRLQDRGHATDIIHDGAEAEAFLRDDGNDLIILDINLPGVDGVTLLRGLRARGDGRPVLLLTARGETPDRVAGLDAGADDYLVKPFEMDELEARVRALLRRAERPIREEVALGGLLFDLAAREARIGADRLDLTRRETALLEALVAEPGRIIARERLLEQLYGTGADVEESAIEVHVSRLRRKIAPAGLVIRAHRGLGYELREAESRTA
jgi:two-component system OmpR family response regulator